MSTEDVEAHTRYAGNTNEDVAEEDVEGHARGGTGNTNEDATEDDVEGHARGGFGNTNEDAASDED